MVLRLGELAPDGSPRATGKDCCREIQLEAKQTGMETFDDAMIVSKQAPYRDELESPLLKLSSIVPLLLQESPKDQCANACQTNPSPFGTGEVR
jgi:hypothetical protein